MGRAFLIALILAVAAGLSAVALAPAFTGEHGEPAIRTEFRRPSVQAALRNTLRIAGGVVAVSTIIGVLVVSLLRFAPRMPRRVLRAAVLLPLIANPLALILSWYVLLQRNGLLVRWLESAGALAQGEGLLFGEVAVVAVMTYLLMPYLVVFAESAWALVPEHAVLAARSLGATRVQAFVRLELPALVRGFVRGVACVFLLAVGYFVTPALLGGSGQTMLGQLIVHEVSIRGDLTRAAAFALPLVAAAGLAVAVLFAAGGGGTDE